MQHELHLLQTLHYSKEEKPSIELPPGVRFLDRGKLLIVKKPILNFVKMIIKNVCGSVNSQSYKQFGLKMTQGAKLKMCNRQTQSMFCACVKLAAGNLSLPECKLAMLRIFNQDF